MGTTGPAPARTMRYDEADNLLSDGVSSYTYSPRGRKATSTVGGTVTSYRYNGLGQRVWQKSSGETANPAGIYVYDEAGKLLGEYDTATGKPAREIIYHQGIPVAVLSYRATGTAPNQVWSTEVGYIFTDHLNTPRVIVRASDNKVVRRWDDADPFGVAPPNENPSGLGTFTFNMRMPGQYYDRATNLFYNYFRDYDPRTGRYVQSDPIGLRGGINTYASVDGHPLTGIDALGLANSGWKPSPGLSQLRMPPDPLPILQATYKEMQEKNVPGTDQFFHCMATCRAKKNGSTPPMIKSYTDMKEASDYARNSVGMYGARTKLPHDEMMADIAKDQAVNDFGMTCPENQSCEQRCNPYIKSLPPRYKIYMQMYEPK